MHDIFDMESSDYDSVIDRTGFDPDRLDVDQVDQHFSVLDSKQQISGSLLDLVARSGSAERNPHGRYRPLRRR